MNCISGFIVLWYYEVKRRLRFKINILNRDTDNFDTGLSHFLYTKPKTIRRNRHRSVLFLSFVLAIRSHLRLCHL
jgi:hypothetical protein